MLPFRSFPHISARKIATRVIAFSQRRLFASKPRGTEYKALGRRFAIKDADYEVLELILDWFFLLNLD